MELPVTARIPALRYLPGALADADASFARLTDEIGWEDRMRARRTASFGQPYNYSGQVYAAAPMPPLVAAIAYQAAALAGHPFDNCLLNLYEGGRNTMGFHHDSYDGLVETSWIAIASLGAARAIVFRSVDHRARDQLVLEHGSVLLMNRAIQLAWAHAIPRSPSAGPRISLTFRRFATVPANAGA
jgi:alkylated DNA repair dioxygenase AlkB